MKILQFISVLLVSLLQKDIKIDNLDFIIKIEDRHLNKKFNMCKTKSMAYSLSSKEIKTFEEIFNNYRKIRKGSLYLGLKQPYRNRYYFRINNSSCFSIEEHEETKYLITHLDTRNKVLLIVVGDRENVDGIKSILKKIDNTHAQ